MIPIYASVFYVRPIRQLLSMLKRWFSTQVQSDDQATHAPKVTTETTRVGWQNLTVREVDCLYRAFSHQVQHLPNPLARTSRFLAVMPSARGPSRTRSFHLQILIALDTGLPIDTERSLNVMSQERLHSTWQGQSVKLMGICAVDHPASGADCTPGTVYFDAKADALAIR